MTRLELQTTRRTELIPITEKIQRIVAASGVQEGICYLYVPHTTAGLFINENADPAVGRDLLYILDRLIPDEDPAYSHREGNSAAHAKATLIGPDAAIPIENCRLSLGTWQGIFFGEFDGPRTRHLLVEVIAG